MSSAQRCWVGLWEADKTSGGLISEKDRHQACQANPPTDQPHFINDIINARQVTCADSEEREVGVEKQIKSQFLLGPGPPKVPRCQLTCLESEEVVGMFTR